MPVAVDTPTAAPPPLLPGVRMPSRAGLMLGLRVEPYMERTEPMSMEVPRPMEAEVEACTAPLPGRLLGDALTRRDMEALVAAGWQVEVDGEGKDKIEEGMATNSTLSHPVNRHIHAP